MFVGAASVVFAVFTLGTTTFWGRHGGGPAPTQYDAGGPTNGAKPSVSVAILLNNYLPCMTWKQLPAVWLTRTTTDTGLALYRNEFT